MLIWNQRMILVGLAEIIDLSFVIFKTLFVVEQ